MRARKQLLRAGHYLVVAHVGIHSAAVNEVSGEVGFGDPRLRGGVLQLGSLLRGVDPLNEAEDVRRLGRGLHRHMDIGIGRAQERKLHTNTVYVNRKSHLSLI